MRTSTAFGGRIYLLTLLCKNEFSIGLVVVLRQVKRGGFCYNRVMDEHDKNLVKWYKSVATALGIIMGAMGVAIIIKVCLG